MTSIVRADLPEPAEPMGADPYLSVVVTARNDNHGGDLLYRIQLFLDALAAQCERHQLPAELILVEWNPPPDRPRLVEVLDLPSADALPVRIIEVPPALHLQLQHAERLPLFQMIAKNVGIRRARGPYVLATNVDVIFSDELMEALARRDLSPAHLYRCDRYDVTSDIPLGAPLPVQLDLCAQRVIRVNRYDATTDLRTGDVYRIYPTKLPKAWPLWLVLTFRLLERAWRKVATLPRRAAHAARRAAWLAVQVMRGLTRLPAVYARLRARNDPYALHTLRRKLASWQARRRSRPPRPASHGLVERVREKWVAFVSTTREAIEWEQARIMLHTNASGDFTLLERSAWERLRGYPELQLFSMHLDSLLLYEAHYAGFTERYLSGPLYHLEHGAGFRPDDKAVEELNTRLEKAAVTQVTLDQFKEWVTTMFRQKAPIVFNEPDWGFARVDLHETTVASADAVSA